MCTHLLYSARIAIKKKNEENFGLSSIRILAEKSRLFKIQRLEGMVDAPHTSETFNSLDYKRFILYDLFFSNEEQHKTI